MTSDRIRETAFLHFSRNGYEGTSLAQIAKDVGIKKPSLYAHYKSKEEIFFACLEYALQSDMAFLQQFLRANRQQAAENVLQNLLVHYEKRVKKHVAAMFCLRMIYFPPLAFKEQLIKRANQRIADIGDLLHPLLVQAKIRGEMKDVSIRDATEAYLCLFDGLMIELMYAGTERFQHRFRASWIVFSKGLFQQQKE